MRNSGGPGILVLSAAREPPVRVWFRRLENGMMRVFGKRIGLWSVLMLCWMAASLASAARLTATGQAVLEEGRYEQARRAAEEDALRQIAAQASIRVSSESRLDRGQLAQDRVRIWSDAEIRGARVIGERVENGILHLTMAADVADSTRASCSLAAGNGYRKQVAMLGFVLQDPAQALVGQMQDLDRTLPGYLARELEASGHLIMLEATHLRLYEDAANAPARVDARQVLGRGLQPAHHLGAQYLVSGVVRDLSLRSPEHFRPSAWNNGLLALGMRDTSRAFEVEVFVHDGFSGELIHRKRYRTQGNWHQAANQAAPFASDRFWQLEYGKQVRSLLDGLVLDLGERLRCLPFVTRITRVDGNLLQFDAGSTAGIRQGDELRVYRTSEFHDAQLRRGVEIRDLEQIVKVMHVQPDFALGRLEVDARRLNIQADDLLIAW